MNRGRQIRRAAAALAVLFGVASAARAGSPTERRPEAASLDATLPVLAPPWTGDLEGMRKRHVIRALVVYSKTFYFLDRGTQHGASYDALRLFEEFINANRPKGELPTRVIFYPVRRDQLLPMLREGKGDIAAANLTVTPDRRELVDVSSPILSGIDQIAVTGPGAPSLVRVDDLSGHEVYVRKSSAAWESLERLNRRFVEAGRPPVRLRAAPEDLQDEDLLEMLNAGIVKVVVVDNVVAKFWSRILPRIRLHPSVAVERNGETAWMFRKNSPELKRAVDQCLVKYPRGSLVRNEIRDRYLESTRWVRNATSKEELVRFRHTVDLFRRYGQQYSLDYLLMMAQGYQESRLDQHARSRVGAIGVMQLMPETGHAMNVGDIHEIDANIHAGVKYIRFVEDQYFADAPMTELNRGLFAFASYDAGPNRIGDLRRIAAERGLDPNVWFNNVELVAAAVTGRETVQYVANIYKYYIAYTLLAEDEAAEKKTLEELDHRRP